MRHCVWDYFQIKCIGNIPGRVNLWTTWRKSEIMKTPRFHYLNWIEYTVRKNQCIPSQKYEHVFEVLIPNVYTVYDRSLRSYLTVKMYKLAFIVLCSLSVTLKQFHIFFSFHIKSVSHDVFFFLSFIFISIAKINILPQNVWWCVCNFFFFYFQKALG